MHELDSLFGLQNVKRLILLLQNAVSAGVVIINSLIHNLILAEIALRSHQTARIERAVLFELEQNEVRRVCFALIDAVDIGRTGLSRGLFRLRGFFRLRRFFRLRGLFRFRSFGSRGSGGGGRLCACHNAEKHYSCKQDRKKLFHRDSS